MRPGNAGERPVRSRCPRACATHRGSVYFGMIVAVTIVGVLLMQTSTLWSAQRRREREADLLAKGDEIRRAIARYHASGPAPGRYPRSLDDLVVDTRLARPAHHLRRAYADPMTGAGWNIVRAPDGGIRGVFSGAKGTPLRQTGFDEADKTFAGQDSYAGWVFLYTPR
ncbi:MULTISPECIES: type II secretion system protein [Pandoraea]|uniref:Type II secretion system protein n=1 Tax=Pandoraea pnomenusa TaxID=93220 RepID=A0A378YQ82_9BURK|nr:MULTISPECIES: type II secretion system protein [Pandoraea]SUA79274.1 Uncharacterised protein [Pandoraea pnomenusa]